jgi:hypothetical protein
MSIFRAPDVRHVIRRVARPVRVDFYVLIGLRNVEAQAIFLAVEVGSV